jgi:hypothetical protein
MKKVGPPRAEKWGRRAWRLPGVSEDKTRLGFFRAGRLSTHYPTVTICCEASGRGGKHRSGSPRAGIITIGEQNTGML